jgi:hypothetical protein
MQTDKYVDWDTKYLITITIFNATKQDKDGSGNLPIINILEIIKVLYTKNKKLLRKNKKSSSGA